MTKKRKKAISGKHLLIISSIIVLNSMGVSYGYLNEQLQFDTTLKTGNIDPVFCNENYEIKVVRDGHRNGSDNESSTLSDLSVSFEDRKHTMVIKGDLEEGYKAFIGYCVYNNGTIPIKYDQSQSKKAQLEELKMQDGLKVQVTQQSEVLEPEGKLVSIKGNGNPKLQIQVPHKSQVRSTETDQETEQEPDDRSFELQLPFEQWTKN